MIRANRAFLNRITSSLQMSGMNFSTSVNKDCLAALASFGITENHDGILINGKWVTGSGPSHTIINPTTAEPVFKVNFASAEDYKNYSPELETQREKWQALPTPVRGEIVRQIGEALRERKEDLAKIIAVEMGKIYQEALGEVQEGIDICDFAVGLSRQISGQVLPSERPEHFMMERWLPLTGNVGIITAFNFPLAVYFWNAALSLVCGNTQVFKPAANGSLIAIACSKLVDGVLQKHGFSSVNSLFLGGADVSMAVVNSHQTSLVSFTGSTQVGRKISAAVAERFGKSILELGGNNAMIVLPDADLDMVVRAALFSAVGTTGQRCTSLRRLYIHEDVYDTIRDRLVESYKNIPIGDPMDPKTLCGPMNSEAGVQLFLNGVKDAQINSGAKIAYGGTRVDRPGFFVNPCIAEVDVNAPCVQKELFAPILYLMKISTLKQAIELNNGVEHGLSSCLFTKNQAAIFHWTSARGSDCGIANVNIGPSGAEIGGAFGGEKATGGGRESGSDAWRQYCRRQTITINYSKQLPLAQGIVFGEGSSSQKKDEGKDFLGF